MKKRFGVFMSLLAVLLCAFALVACGGGGDNQEEEKPEPTLNGKTLVFLGSSVTYGSASDGYSFVDELQRLYPESVCVKEAVSGTNLCTGDGNSYVERFDSSTKISELEKVDYVMIQLSTNDATNNKPLGTFLQSEHPNDFRKNQITGAIQYLVSSAKERWEGCTVAFYTNPKYSNANYKRMVDRLIDIKAQWEIDFEILDLYNDESVSAIIDDKAQYDKYMKDSIHPNRDGYVEWWTPIFEEFILRSFPAV